MPARHAERGAAVSDFVMVSALVTLVFMTVLQVGLFVHVRNTLISCASEGARYGSRVGSSPELGAERTRSLIESSVSPRFAQNVAARSEVTSAGVQVVTVTVRAPFPVVGYFGPDAQLNLSGRAFSESQ